MPGGVTGIGVGNGSPALCFARGRLATHKHGCAGRLPVAILQNFQQGAPPLTLQTLQSPAFLQGFAGKKTMLDRVAITARSTRSPCTAVHPATSFAPYCRRFARPV